MSEKKVKAVKSAKWACVLYPESLPDSWLDELRRYGVKAALSPLHDRDKNPDGTLKKAHYHGILCYDGPTTYNNVKHFVCDVLGQPVPQECASVRGNYRYFCHLDHPDKVQYDEQDIQTFNGFDIMDYVEMSKSEKFRIQKKLLRMIRDCEIYEYAQLLYILLDSDMDAELDVAMGSTMMLRGAIQSLRGMQERRAQEIAQLGRVVDAMGSDSDGK